MGMSTNQMILMVSIQIIGFLIVGGMAYRAQKGKNQADMEDAPILTKIQETIKQELGHKTAVKSSVYKDRKDAAIKLNETVQEINIFIGSIRALPVDITAKDYDTHTASYKTFLMEVEKAWTKLDLLANSTKLETDYFEWRFSIGNQFDDIQDYMDNRILYNQFLDGKKKAIDAYRTQRVEHRIEDIEKHIQYEQDKMTAVYNRYVEQRKIHNANVEKASKQLKDDITKIVADETIV